jgi:2-C-methyl-D-erythritol 2,4-cyclodiphosphate synthase
MMRVGQGIDFHRFAENRKLILGGIEIVYPLGLLGHSDADVLIHSLCDALLGALGLGDIGEHYNDEDPRWKDLDSKTILLDTLKRVEQREYTILNMDLTIIGEEPRLSPYKEEIKDNLSKLCQLSKEAINIKATTTERMGALGNKEGLAALSIVLLARKGRQHD